MFKFTTYVEWLWEVIKLHILWIGYLVRGAVVLGFFPATTAVYAVARYWLKHGDTERVSVLFKKFYKENFKTSNYLGWIVLFASFIVCLNWFYIPYVEQMLLKFVMYGIVITFTFLLILTSLYVFPVIANYQLQLVHYVIIGVKIGLSYFPYTILQVVLITGLAMMYVRFPQLTLIFGIVPITFVQMYICNHVFRRLNHEQISTT
jgi:uncharacterized membrane protein YesL